MFPEERDTSVCFTETSVELDTDYNPAFRKFEMDRLSIEYAGFLYIDGHLAGEPTAKWILDNWLALGPKRVAASVKGRFLVHLHDREQHVRYTFVDHAGLFPAYFTSKKVSSSFRQLIGTEGSATSSINIDRALELLLYSYVPWDNTLCDGIQRLNGKMILVSKQNQQFLEAKALPPFRSDEKLDADILSASFKNLAYAISDIQISCDLTGGVDSRFVATMLNSAGVTFETGLAAFPNHADAVIGSEVASALDVPFHLTLPDEENYPNMEKLYIASDGLSVELEKIARKSLLQQDRRRRGVQLSLDGIGGSIFKDQWWLQDFPFYNSRTPRPERLYRAHIHSFNLARGILSSDAAVRLNNVQHGFLEKMYRYKADSNTEVYDLIYYDLQPYLGGLINAGLHTLSLIDTYSPLLEYERARFAFNLPRHVRSFDTYQRSEITRRSPEAARVKTTRGVTAEGGMSSLARHGLSYSMNISKRALDKVSQLTLKRRIWKKSAPGNPIAFANKLQRTEQFADAVGSLKGMGLLRQDVATMDIPSAIVPHIYVLGRVQAEITSR